MDDYLTAEQAAEAAKGLNFETVWAALMETRKNSEESNRRMEESNKQLKASIEQSNRRMEESNKEFKASMEESNKEFKASMEESDKRMEQSSQELKKLVADVTKNLGGLGNTLGKLTEALLSSELWKKFVELGYEFSRQSQRYQFVENRRVIAEADFWLENGEYAMAVEVKTELTLDDVKMHLERMDVIRRYMDSHGDARKMIGAVAGGIVAANVASFAHRNGFYVVVQSGDAIAVADRPDGFKARQW